MNNYANRARLADARQAQNREIHFTDFAAAHPDVWQWLQAKQATFDFAASLIEKLGRWGDLTEGQMAAVQRLMARDAVRAQERTQRDTTAPSVDASALRAAFDMAYSKGLKRPKMRFNGFLCSMAPMTGRNPGAIYVKGDDDAYLGKVTEGKFFATAACSQRAEIAATLSDPLAAAIAYGRRSGRCSICNKELTVEKSVERGIGPVCAARFGY